MFKKIILLFLVLFTLFSCGDSNTDGLKVYNSTGFTLRIPKKWELLKNDTSILPKPSSGRLELIITSKSQNDSFFNSMVILSEDLKKDVSSKDYSSLNNLAMKGNYFLYKDVKSENLNFGDDSDSKVSKVYIFDVKYKPNMDTLRFLQTGITCGKKGYIITLAVPKNTNNILKYKYIFSTFRCKG